MYIGDFFMDTGPRAKNLVFYIDSTPPMCLGWESSQVFFLLLGFGWF